MSNSKNFELTYLADTNKRLDIFLAEEFQQSRSQILKSIKQKLVLVNNKIISKAGHILEKGYLVSGSIQLQFLPEEPIKPEAIDKDLIVINKAAGLVVHPAGYLREGTLVNALLHKYQQNELSDLNSTDGFRPGIVHRLDKDTSGLMLVAKNNNAHQALAKQLANRSLKRVYWAVVWGCFKEETGFVEAPIGRHPRDRKKMAVLHEASRHKSRSAKTHWKLLEEFQTSKPKASLLELKLETGRTHQIRVHLEHIGHPVLGDQAYGGKLSQTHLINRQALHAKQIQFIHPTSQKSMAFQSELPSDIEFLLGKLKK
jgi:23S rRNA pseudouridine1911/1915/1917 synthase